MIIGTKITSLEQIKALENPTVKSKYRKNGNVKENEFWTIDVPLIAEHERNGIILINRWFINNSNELIYSENNDFMNLEMYLGIIKPGSWIKELTVLRIDRSDE